MCDLSKTHEDSNCNDTDLEQRRFEMISILHKIEKNISEISEESTSLLMNPEKFILHLSTGLEDMGYNSDPILNLLSKNSIHHENDKKDFF